MAAQEYLCKVKSFRMLTRSVFELKFETNRPLDFIGGQFISVVIPGAGPQGRDLRRAYSIASSPEINPIELCIKLVPSGPGTTYLSHLRNKDDQFKIFAPYGDFVYKTLPQRHACFIATGTGVAPFRSMVFSKAFRSAPPLSAHCLFGVRDEEELLYMDDFAKESSTNPLFNQIFRWLPTLSRPSSNWKGLQGRVTDLLKNMDSGFAWLETDYYLCGNGAMIDEVKAFLLAKGIPKAAIHQEIYFKPKSAPA